MELRSTKPSAMHVDQHVDVKGMSSGEIIKWDNEISFEEAYRAIEGKFYFFKKVQLAALWLDFA